MTFKEVETLAKFGAPIKEQYPSIYVIAAHSALVHLYERYRNGVINTTDAAKEKQSIKIAYEHSVDVHEKYVATCNTFNEQIKLSDQFRVSLHKGIQSGDDLEELFLLACTCIAVLTGDKTLAGSTVGRQLDIYNAVDDAKQ